MNKQIKELSEQAGLMPMWVCVNEPTGSQMIKPIDEQTIERFAELVRADERAVHALYAEKIQQDLNVYKTIIARFKQQLKQGSES